jgi:hypothetical protein
MLSFDSDASYLAYSIIKVVIHCPFLVRRIVSIKYQQWNQEGGLALKSTQGKNEAVAAC